MTETETGPKVSTRLRLRFIAVGTAAALTVTGAAYAYYTTIGTGGGSGTVDSGEDLGPTAVHVESNPVQFARPGTSVEVYGRFVNKGETPISVERATAEVDYIKDSNGQVITDPAVCGAADFEFTDVEFTPPVEVPAKAGGLNGIALWGGAGSDENITVTFVNDPDRNQDGCKGATVHLSLFANPA